jgi:hypothetical protein
MTVILVKPHLFHFELLPLLTVLIWVEIFYVGGPLLAFCTRYP